MKPCRLTSQAGGVRSMCGPKHCPMQTKITDEDLAGLEELIQAKKGSIGLESVK